MKTVLVGLVMAAAMLAETVHFGQASKVFHKTATCSSRTGHKLTAERKEAEAHGLRACLRCWKQCGTDSECEGVQVRKGNGAWAKQAPADQAGSKAADKGGK